MLASAPETGQPVLASSANFRNSSSVSPGTFATTVRSLPVMPTPGWKPTTALVSTDSGGVPLPARACERAIE